MADNQRFGMYFKRNKFFYKTIVLNYKTTGPIHTFFLHNDPNRLEKQYRYNKRLFN